MTKKKKQVLISFFFHQSPPLLYAFVHFGHQLVVLDHSYNHVQGFPNKDARFSNFKNIPDLLSNEMEGEIVEISTINILAIGRLLWETL